MPLNELVSQFMSVVLQPKLLELFASLLAINLLLNGFACDLVHLDDLRTDYLVDLICW